MRVVFLITNALLKSVIRQGPSGGLSLGQGDTIKPRMREAPTLLPPASAPEREARWSRRQGNEMNGEIKYRGEACET